MGEPEGRKSAGRLLTKSPVEVKRTKKRSIGDRKGGAECETHSAGRIISWVTRR